MSSLRLLAIAACVASACGDNLPAPPSPPGPPDVMDAAVAAFIDVMCTSACVSGTEAQCRADLSAEFARVKPGLDEQGHEECAACLDAKRRMMAHVIDCMPTAAQTDAIDAVCDLDPTVDADNDGNPANDYSDACGGVP